jgi:hypothetical protein
MRHRQTSPLPYSVPRDASHGARWDGSDGGPPQRGRVSFGNRSIPNHNRIAEATFYKTRGPYFTVGNIIPIADPIRATDCGPERPRMHMATGAYRRMSGTSNTHWKQYHTYLDQTMQQSLAQGTTKGGMRTVRMNRLTMQQYRGQTYSQTTRPLGV